MSKASATSSTATTSPSTDTRTEVLLVGEGTWAKGKTEAEALKGLQKLGWRGDRYLAYLVTPKTVVDSYGMFVYEANDDGTWSEPKLYARLRRINRKWKREEV